jgi:hypothetical protein
MGASITAQVHFFDRHDPTESFETGANIEVWDFERDLGLTGGKDYVFISAISGVRGPKGFKPLIPRRGVPPNWRNNGWVEEDVGWLYWSEIEAALKHRGVTVNDLDPSTQRVLRAVKGLVDELGDRQVRFVFWVLD